MKTIHALLVEARAAFRAAGIEEADADARLLVQHVFGMTREELLLKAEAVAADTQVKSLRDCVARRLKREPVSRIAGLRSFWKSDFKISRETLDPRADSEVLIGAVLKHLPPPPACMGEGRGEGAAAQNIALHPESQGPLPNPLPQGEGTVGFSILDLGTGSGCLLLSLLQEFPGAAGRGIDISEDAVHTARENAAALGLAARASFVAGDWNRAEWKQEFDVIISNPPYVTEEEMKTLEPEVALFDPPRALYGGRDGLDCYRDIVALLPRLLKPSGLVFFETGYRQAGPVKDLLEQAGFTVLEIVTDLAGHDRCVVAKGGVVNV